MINLKESIEIKFKNYIISTMNLHIRQNDINSLVFDKFKRGYDATCIINLPNIIT